MMGLGFTAPETVIAEPRRAVQVRRNAPPDIVGKSAIVIDANARNVLYTKNADTRRQVASTQKILTALLSLEKGLDGTVTVASSDTQVEPIKLYISAGQRYRRVDLITALLVKSGNDVARCLARDHSGSQENFAASMNAKAKRLGMRNSHFVTANGLTADGQYSTARDMGILALEGYSNRTIRSIVEKPSVQFRFATGKEVTLVNTNKLLHGANRSPYCNGMKTGYTKAAGRCLVSSAERGRQNIVCVVLGSTPASIWKDSTSLLHWALGVS